MHSRWARRWLGLETGAGMPAEARRTPSRQELDQQAAEEAAAMRRAALRIWLSAKPRLDGTPVDL